MTYEVPDYLLWLLWVFLSNAPAVSRSGLDVPPIESQDMLEDLLEDSGIRFAVDLAQVLRSVIPPTIGYFKSLDSDDTARIWGVYMLVLEHDQQDHRARLYAGSGTHPGHSVAQRWNDYDNGIALPRFVQEALDEGYTITHKALLCWSPIPSAANRFPLRSLYLTMEAAFCTFFWAFKLKTNDYRMPTMCPWKVETLPWDGACSHASLFEGLRMGGASGLKPEEIEAHDNYMRGASLRNYYKLKQSDFAAWQAQRRKYAARRDPEERISTARKITAKNRAEQKYRCELCDETYGCQGSLDVHLNSISHKNKVNGVTRPLTSSMITYNRNVANKTYWCAICSYAAGSRGHFDNHLAGARHIARAELHAERVANGLDTTMLAIAVAPKRKAAVGTGPQVVTEVVTEIGPQVVTERVVTETGRPQQVGCDEDFTALVTPSTSIRLSPLIPSVAQPSHTAIGGPKRKGLPDNGADEVDDETDASDLYRLSAEDRAAANAHDRKVVAARKAKAIEEQKHRCDVCQLNFGSKPQLTNHLKSKKHKEMAEQPEVVAARLAQSSGSRAAARLARAAVVRDRKHVCAACDIAYGSFAELKRHYRSKMHIHKVAAPAASVAPL